MKPIKFTKIVAYFATFFLFINFISCCDDNDPLPEVIVDFTVESEMISEGGTLTFTDISMGSPNSWNWTFEGGTPSSSNEQNPTIIYNTPGIYSVTLKASNQESTDELIKTDIIIVVPTSGLVAYYPFSGNFNDASGNDNDAMNFGVEFTKDISNNDGAAALFNGTSYLKIPHANELNFAESDFSISIWLKTSSSSEQMLLQKGGFNGPDDPQYWVRLNDSSGDITFLTGNGMPPSAIVSSDQGAINDNVWHHVVAVRDGNKLKLYLDNQLISEVTENQQNIDDDQSIKIGAQIFGSIRNYFSGALDEIRIYGKALSPDEVKVLNVINQNDIR